ncbi:MAG: methyltransferase domain-containing protein, partial [Deltaproteobacteria bacterium]|nr:methyltransferase domain-containing protein [Deltaproteobacteria bacterium]
MSDDKPYILPSSDAESRRLEEQATLYGGTDFLDPFLAAEPAAVLDAGCGTGFFTRHAAGRLPESRVVGLDQDEGRLALARRLGGLTNLEFQQGDLGALPFGDGEFDLVFSRFVTVHATDPDGDLAEQLRVTRAGGTVVAYDMVHSGVWFSPHRPAFAAVLAEATRVMRERGMEPDQ